MTWAWSLRVWDEAAYLCLQTAGLTFAFGCLGSCLRYSEPRVLSFRASLNDVIIELCGKLTDANIDI